MGGIAIKPQGLLNLLTNVPQQVLTKLVQLSKNEEVLQGKVELTVIYGARPEQVAQSVGRLGGSFEDLGYNFGIVTLNAENIEKISQVEGIQYVELPKTVYTSDASSNRAACVDTLQDIYGLTGEGVLVGFIDSGIDYTHPAFIDDKGETRIDYILDFSQGGKVWNRTDINNALKSTNPLSVVPEQDTLGHGTHVAGIACAGGKIDKQLYGVAYKSSIAMVKITPGGKVSYSKDTLIMRGIKFLVEKSKELKKPLVINLSFSTNDGSHEGSSLFEQYINTVCRLEAITFVIASGNEGDKAHHIGGTVQEKQSILMNISSDEIGIILQVYKDVQNNFTLEMVNPSGVSSGEILLDQGYKEGKIGEDRYYIYNTGPKPYNISGEIIISLLPVGNYLTSGEWKLNITCIDEYKGNYNIWMPISESLNPNTKFLRPNVFNTLGIPATVNNVISVGSYDYRTNNISFFSGRGALSSNTIKPDLVSPGEEILSTVPGKTTDTKSGTSMATPHVTGICALFAEWGMVKGNDPFLYGERLKYYLLKGARRNRPGVTYPNPTWGYGEVCASDAFELLKLSRGDVSHMGYINREMKVGGKEYSNYVIEYDGDIVKAIQNIDYAKVFILDENYAIIAVEKGREEELRSKVPQIVYVDRTYIFTLMETQPVDAANITEFHSSPYLNLTGRGVLVGIVDTGIEYLNNEFTYEDDTTRIERMWDQTDDKGPAPLGLPYGTEYRRNQINDAIKASKAGRDPYSIVGMKDTVGHGTQMAGLIGSRGKNREIIGAAPDCEFVIVKLRPNSSEQVTKMMGYNFDKVPTYDTTNIITGIKYLTEVGKELNKPMVIYVPLGSNRGPHDGNTVIERYIDNISKVRGLAVVTGLGNQGDTDTHTSGTLEKTGDTKTIEIRVAPLQRHLTFEIWAKKPDKISLGIISPSGENVERIPAKLNKQEKINLVFEGSKILVEYFLPEELTGDELIRVRIDNVREGVWQFKLTGDFIVDGRFDAWLPQAPLSESGTKFLSPTPFTTLQTPSTSTDILCCGFYNQSNNSIVSQSSRGYTRDGRIKPDIAVGGINAKTTSTGGGVTTVSGSSVGAAIYAGACALLFQWGVVEKNDPTLYATKMKTYFIRGATRRKGDTYPNPEWGYGLLNLRGVFENIRHLDEKMRSYKEFSLGDVYINIPSELL